MTMQDLFISRITKTLSKLNRCSRRTRKGWFTKEQMSNNLNWSARLGSTLVGRPRGLNTCSLIKLRSYIKSVIEHCDKRAEKLVKILAAHI